MNNQQYRIKQYNHGAWCVEKLHTHGKKSKTPGKTQWKEWKFPGNLEQAATLLLSLVVGTNEYANVQELIAAIKSAELEISEKIQLYIRSQETK